MGGEIQYFVFLNVAKIKVINLHITLFTTDSSLLAYYDNLLMLQTETSCRSSATEMESCHLLE